MNKNSPIHHIPETLRLTDNVLIEASERFGTPLYVYDADLMNERWNLLHSILPKNITLFYSVKANPNISIINIFKELGANFEIASHGELSAVLQTGVSPRNIIFIGPGKTPHELNEATHYDLKAIVVESKREVEDLQILSHNKGKKTAIALRINPGRGKGTIIMGGATQFGMEKQQALDILINANRYSDLKIIGLHAYLGTGILEWRTIVEHTEIILHTFDDLQKISGKEFSFIDVGGGFGIPYYEGEQSPNWNELREPLYRVINEYLEKYSKTEIIAVESGRFLTGPSGVFVTRVVDVKKSGNKKFVILDGGTNVFGGDNRYRGFRPTPIKVLNSYNNTNIEPLTLCGPLCTSADQLAVDTLLPLPNIGNLIAFYQAGAYGLTASPGLFLSHGFPNEIIYEDNKLHLIGKNGMSLA